MPVSSATCPIARRDHRAEREAQLGERVEVFLMPGRPRRAPHRRSSTSRAHPRCCARPGPGSRHARVLGVEADTLPVRMRMVHLADGAAGAVGRGAGVAAARARHGRSAARHTYFATGWARVLATRVGAVAYPASAMCTCNPPRGLAGWRCTSGWSRHVLLGSRCPRFNRGFVYSTAWPAVVGGGGLIWWSG
jgi:hypothetical protein